MYKIGTNFLGQPFIYRVADSAFIPEDPGNRDYQEYLVWVSEGNVAAPWP